ncbi:MULTISPECIES: FHA domain-containing protein [Microbulbifer]|uniref:FHA domain-containing protein n=1 Tax=Microbulbifer celer TaxID=435905 RepID=A0ABW3UA34_9GAMM|nr:MULTISPECIES: FHA domain-containing protein [Microbulbifer]UFN58962.1 FHA domain-containing protein [Microbulbifer celer]
MLKLCDVKDASQSVWLVSPKVTVGRSSQCDMTLADSSVAKLHIEILVNGEELELHNLAGAGHVAVNGKLVDGHCKLGRNDRVQLGERNLAVIDPKITRIKAAGAGANVSWALRANHPAIVGRVYPVRETSVVGRSDECDLTFAMSHLSRRHARLEVREGLLFVLDLGSANGTFLNNQRITESRVRRGDELRFDSLSFSVVGPADDLNKTTVRQAVSPTPEAASATAVHSGAGSSSGALAQLRDSGMPNRTAGGATSAGYPMPAQGGGVGKWLWLPVLAAIAIAGFLVARSQGAL